MKKTILIISIILLSFSIKGQSLNLNNNSVTIDASDNYINFNVDSVSIPGAIAQFHRIDSIDVVTAGSWITIKFDSLIANESTYGYKFNADSTGFYVSFEGSSRVQGCGHWI